MWKRPLRSLRRRWWQRLRPRLQPHPPRSKQSLRPPRSRLPSPRDRRAQQSQPGCRHAGALPGRSGPCPGRQARHRQRCLADPADAGDQPHRRTGRGVAAGLRGSAALPALRNVRIQLNARPGVDEPVRWRQCATDDGAASAHGVDILNPDARPLGRSTPRVDAFAELSHARTAAEHGLGSTWRLLSPMPRDGRCNWSAIHPPLWPAHPASPGSGVAG